MRADDDPTFVVEPEEPQVRRPELEDLAAKRGRELRVAGWPLLRDELQERSGPLSLPFESTFKAFQELNQWAVPADAADREDLPPPSRQPPNAHRLTHRLTPVNELSELLGLTLSTQLGAAARPSNSEKP